MTADAWVHVAGGAFAWLAGLCVGSFLNVVVYRLPLGMSVSRPRRSFCPACGAQIAWRDNVPLASWLLLRGRCRACAAPIPVRYPLVEAITGLAFVLVFHLLVVQQARIGVEFPGRADAPILVAWLTLAAVMVVCSVMDLTAYAIDVRVTNVCLFAGIALHALWPGAAQFQGLTASPVGAAGCAAGVVGGLMLAIGAWRAARSSAAPDVHAPDTDPQDFPPRTGRPHAAGRGAAHLSAAACVALIGVLAPSVWLAIAPGFASADVDALARLPVPAGMLALFAAIVLAGGQRRDADDEIHHAVESESPHARRDALRDLLWLSPALLAAAAAFLIVWRFDAARLAWDGLLGLGVGPLQPATGAAYAVLGASVGAAAGWLLRIGFTLAFGREAFGTGDIYILAAAGAAAGWDVVLGGLLLSVGLALAGWLAQLLLKSSVMIPFGPWLGLGFLCALWLNRPIRSLASAYREMIAATWADNPAMLYAAGGIMLIGAAAAIVVARGVRAWLERGGG